MTGTSRPERFQLLRPLEGNLHLHAAVRRRTGMQRGRRDKLGIRDEISRQTDFNDRRRLNAEAVRFDRFAGGIFAEQRLIEAELVLSSWDGDGADVRFCKRTPANNGPPSEDNCRYSTASGCFGSAGASPVSSRCMSSASFARSSAFSAACQRANSEPAGITVPGRGLSPVRNRNATRRCCRGYRHADSRPCMFAKRPL